LDASQDHRKDSICVRSGASTVALTQTPCEHLERKRLPGRSVLDLQPVVARSRTRQRLELPAQLGMPDGIAILLIVSILSHA
jgi:hypothetical protein